MGVKSAPKKISSADCLRALHLAHCCMCCTQPHLLILSGVMVLDFIFMQLTPSDIWLLNKLLFNDRSL